MVIVGRSHNRRSSLPPPREGTHLRGPQAILLPLEDGAIPPEHAGVRTSRNGAS
uniref:Predicted protein n=1 Tax=Hordeum vulgare subsp. vulgare TaxID=112509 RepID=F2EK82_HORVV|nr:predicted protein [Hordeum vulgare subsp. vulgare]